MKISGQRTKLNVIRADRADGIYLKNFTVEYWTGAAWAVVPGGTVTNNTLAKRK